MIMSQSEEKLVHFPLLHPEVPALAPAEQLGCPRSVLVVAVVEALGEVGAAVAVQESPVAYLQVWVSEGWSERTTAPNCLVFVDQWVALA